MVSNVGRENSGVFHPLQDEETQESVAMKKIENAFEHITCLGSQCIFRYNIRDVMNECNNDSSNGDVRRNPMKPSNLKRIIHIDTT